MAYAFVQSGQNHTGSATPSPLTASSITVTAANALVVWIFSLNAGPQTVSGNGNTYTFAGTSANTSGFLSAYYCQNINGGATAVATSDTGCFAIYAAEYSGLSTSGGAVGTFVPNSQLGPGTGSHILTSTACNVVTAPAAVFAFAVDVAGVQSVTAILQSADRWRYAAVWALIMPQQFIPSGQQPFLISGFVDFTEDG